MELVNYCGIHIWYGSITIDRFPKLQHLINVLLTFCSNIMFCSRSLWQLMCSKIKIMQFIPRLWYGKCNGYSWGPLPHTYWENVFPCMSGMDITKGLVVNDSVVQIPTLLIIYLGFFSTHVSPRTLTCVVETTNKRTNKHLTHSNMKQIRKGGKYQITLKFYYRTIPQMAWSQPGSRPSGISVKSTTHKDDMTHIRIIHWFSEQHIYNRQARLLETRIVGQAYI